MDPDVFLQERYRADKTLRNLTPQEVEFIKKFRYGVGVVDQFGRYGLNVLHYAAINGWHEAIPYLVELGIDINHQNVCLNVTPLMQAIEGSYVYGRPGEQLDQSVFKKRAIDTANVLLDNGANPLLVDHMKKTALHKAVERDMIPTAQRLIEMGTDPNTKDELDRIPLDSAKSVEMINLLADKGTDMNYTGSYGGRIHKAFNLDILRALLDKGTNPNLQDKYGQTPMFSILDNRYNTGISSTPFLLELLLRGADPSIPSKFGPIERIANSHPDKKKDYEDALAKFAEIRGKKLVAMRKDLPPNVEKTIQDFLIGERQPLSESGILSKRLKTAIDSLNSVKASEPDKLIVAMTKTIESLETFGSQPIQDAVKRLRDLNERATQIITSENPDLSPVLSELEAVKKSLRGQMQGGRKTRMRKIKRRKTLRRK